MDKGDKKGGDGGPVKILNPKMRQKLLADKKRRERELLQKKIAAGVDYLGDDNDIRLSKDRENMSTIQKIIIYVGEFIENLKPFKTKVNMIKINYDRSISLFFEIIQFVFVFNLFTAILFVYLCLTHYLKAKDEFVYFKDKYCGYMYPCVFFFSRFDESLKYWYVLTMFIFGFMGLGMFLYSWIQFDKKANYQRIFQQDNIIYARQIFNGWTWSVNNQEEYATRKLNILNDVSLSLKEDIIRDEVKRRTPQEKQKLVIGRIVAKVISLFVLLIGWCVIFLGTYYENIIQGFFLRTTG